MSPEIQRVRSTSTSTSTGTGTGHRHRAATRRPKIAGQRRAGGRREEGGGRRIRELGHGQVRLAVSPGVSVVMIDQNKNQTKRETARREVGGENDGCFTWRATQVSTGDKQRAWEMSIDKHPGRRLRLPRRRGLRIGCTMGTRFQRVCTGEQRVGLRVSAPKWGLGSPVCTLGAIQPSLFPCPLRRLAVAPCPHNATHAHRRIFPPALNQVAYHFRKPTAFNGEDHWLVSYASPCARATAKMVPGWSCPQGWEHLVFQNFRSAMLLDYPGTCGWLFTVKQPTPSKLFGN